MDTSDPALVLVITLDLPKIFAQIDAHAGVGSARPVA
jgi:hypothetical protein